MSERRVHRGDLHEALKRIEREGTERHISTVHESEDVFIVTTERLDQPKKETR